MKNVCDKISHLFPKKKNSSQNSLLINKCCMPCQPDKSHHNPRPH